MSYKSKLPRKAIKQGKLVDRAKKSPADVLYGKPKGMGNMKDPEC